MMRQANQTDRARGATLLEVMVAMGILATAYVALLRTQSGSIELSTYGKQITVATFLAQTLLEESEERLTREGFPDMDEEEEGDFEELGYPGFTWRLEINKVELPLGAAFEHLLASFGGGEGEEGKEGGGMLDKLGGGAGLPGQLSGMLEGVKGKMGSVSNLLNPEMLRGQVDMLADMLEQAIRELRLTVVWEGGGEGDQLVITTHLVRVPEASAAAGAGAAGATGTPAGQPGAAGAGPNQVQNLIQKFGGGSGKRPPTK